MLLETWQTRAEGKVFVIGPRSEDKELKLLGLVRVSLTGVGVLAEVGGLVRF